MSTKAKIQKVKNEIQAHEDRGWLLGYEEGLATREEEIKRLQKAMEGHNSRIRELSRQKNGPKTAREALARAWELAHPVKEGQMFPAGTELLQKNLDGTIRSAIMAESKPATEIDENHTRALDPLPLPEPDWLDAPAVLAHLDNPIFQQKVVFTPTSAKPDCWTQAGTALTFHWSKLRDVTPLYLKGQDA